MPSPTATWNSTTNRSATSSPGRIEAFEALVRWRHPVRGLLHPDAFLPDVAAAGLAERLTTRVAEAVAVTAGALAAATGRPIPVSLNVDRWHQPVDDLITLLTEHAAALDAVESLIVEFPERVLAPTPAWLSAAGSGRATSSAWAEDVDPATLVRRLRMGGVGVAVDGGDGDGAALAGVIEPDLLSWYKLGRQWMEPHLRPALPAVGRALSESLPGVRPIGVGIADAEARSDAAASLSWGQGFALGRPVEGDAVVDLVT